MLVEPQCAIANWFFLPYGLALGGVESVGLAGIATNLVSVTIGNILGGTLLVARRVLGRVYARRARRTGSSAASPSP